MANIVSFKTFRIIAIAVFVLIGVGLLYGLVRGVMAIGSYMTSPSTTSRPRNNNPASAPSQPQSTRSVSTDEIRATLEQWLNSNPRQGQMKQNDILPNEPYRATAIRFRESDAVKWSNNPNQWSQIKLDLDRDGIDDEKWLLMNGHTYKREVLDRAGNTVETQKF